MKQPNEATLREAALRDGLQSERAFVPTDVKLERTRLLSLAGVRIFETASFVSPSAIPQLRDAAGLDAQCGVRRG